MDKKQLKDDLSNYEIEDYERPSVAVDVSLCSVIDGELKILLIKRNYPPFRDYWALPGGFLDPSKKISLEHTATDMLKRELNINYVYIEQLKTYGNPERDPRTRVITVAYFALIPEEEVSKLKVTPKDDAETYKWFNLRKLPQKIAFDHKFILIDLLQRLIGKISYTPIAFNLVSEYFTWKELQDVYEAILGESLVTPNFRRKIKDLYHIEELKEKKKNDSRGRPGICLHFKEQKNIY